MAGALIAAAILVCALAIMAYRASCNGATAKRFEGVAHASDFAVLRVIVRTPDNEAELEIETDTFDSYEELRELVVDSVPEMFHDTDELTLEYQNARSRWQRVKRSTPVDTVKAARSARISVAGAKAVGRRRS